MEERSKNSRTVIIALILLIIFVLILILFLYPAFFGSFAQSENFTSEPTDSEVITPQSVSFDNSYLFASPLRAAAKVERIRITAYILDGQGMGVSGKQVILGNGNTSLQIYPISPVTDDSGRATFDVSSTEAGLFTIEASVGSKKLSQKVTVSFN
ncbi:MAG: hypothetical protein UT88_C0039G0003 [Candidatus Woesebacteria bacterium GW2011_GWD2_40_19]|nr:MAG: hypothetical protein UT88_C0039G0003 [Candidatus Woesebacteria bacterium GW2011_GWD2_40_19]